MWPAALVRRDVLGQANVTVVSVSHADVVFHGPPAEAKDQVADLVLGAEQHLAEGNSWPDQTRVNGGTSEETPLNSSPLASANSAGVHMESRWSSPMVGKQPVA